MGSEMCIRDSAPEAVYLPHMSDKMSGSVRLEAEWWPTGERLFSLSDASQASETGVASGTNFDPMATRMQTVHLVQMTVHHMKANGSSALLPFRRAPGGLAVRRFGIASAPAGVPGTHSWRSLRV